MNQTEYFEDEIEPELRSLIEKVERAGMAIAVFVVTEDNDEKCRMVTIMKTPGAEYANDLDESMWPAWMKPVILAMGSKGAQDVLETIYPIARLESRLGDEDN